MSQQYDSVGPIEYPFHKHLQKIRSMKAKKQLSALGCDIYGTKWAWSFHTQEFIQPAPFCSEILPLCLCYEKNMFFVFLFHSSKTSSPNGGKDHFPTFLVLHDILTPVDLANRLICINCVYNVGGHQSEYFKP